jgi:hypothetical protein
MVGYYLFLLIILFLFGVYNLFTRVKNDAIVYLHPTLAEGIASRWTILIIAGAGMLLGALLSQEMLVIPRKVIFNPGVFVFSDIMVIFMAMMIWQCHLQPLSWYCLSCWGHLLLFRW